MDETKAVARLKAGDIDGLRTLVEIYQSEAVQAACLITGDRAAAEDVVQTAFLRAYEKITGFDEARPFRPWFLRMAVNEALKAVARQRRRISLEDEGDADYQAVLQRLDTTAREPEDVVQRKELVEEMQRAASAAFYFGSPSGKVTVGLISNGPWGFVPLSPTYLPRGDWVTVPDSFKDEATGVEALKLTINEGDQFVILTQSKALLGEPLPDGEQVSVHDRPAVMVTGMSGEAEAGIPLDENGGVLPEPSGLIRLYPIQYTNGVRLTWQLGEIRLEILSNLPVKQVMKIAASLRPVETGPAEIITAEP